jgi:hypothetical protein
MRYKRNLFNSKSPKYKFFKGIYLKASSTYYLCDFYSHIDDNGIEIFKVLVQTAQVMNIELMISFNAADNIWICENTHTQPEELVERIIEQIILKCKI